MSPEAKCDNPYRDQCSSPSLEAATLEDLLSLILQHHKQSVGKNESYPKFHACRDFKIIGDGERGLGDEFWGALSLVFGMSIPRDVYGNKLRAELRELGVEFYTR